MVTGNYRTQWPSQDLKCLKKFGATLNTFDCAKARPNSNTKESLAADAGTSCHSDVGQGLLIYSLETLTFSNIAPQTPEILNSYGLGPKTLSHVPLVSSRVSR